MSWHAIAAAAIGLALVLTNQTVSAQDAKDPSTDAMIEALAPAAPRTRSLRNLQAQPRQIDLNIQFDFDSSRLRPESLELVERLAAALKSDRLRDQRFRIEGHTDAKGRADYNQQLSDRRADAVRRQLTQSGVTPERLLATGKGATEPLNTQDPFAPENRRVRILALEQ